MLLTVRVLEQKDNLRGRPLPFLRMSGAILFSRIFVFQRNSVTRASRKQSLSSIHKSLVTDHVVEKNHVIGWDRAKVIGIEQNRYKRCVKEAIEIRKRRGTTMNRDQGQYFFHTFLMNCFLKNPQREENQLATPDFPLAEVQLVLVGAVSSSVEKVGRCPRNVHSKSITFWIRNQVIFLIMDNYMLYLCLAYPNDCWWTWYLNVYLSSLGKDIKRIKSSNSLYVPADKTRKLLNQSPFQSPLALYAQSQRDERIRRSKCTQRWLANERFYQWTCPAPCTQSTRSVRAAVPKDYERDFHTAYLEPCRY